MRVITWNCCKGKHANKLRPLLKLRPDIAVIQESPKPTEQLGHAQDWHGTNKNQGILVVTFNGWTLSRVRNPAKAPEFFLPFRVSKGRSHFHLIAVWVKKGNRPPLYYSGISKAFKLFGCLIKSQATVLLGRF